MRNKTNSILISRAPLNYEKNTSYDKHFNKPSPVYYIGVIFFAWVLVAFLSFEIMKNFIETRVEMKLESRLSAIEQNQRRLNTLLYLED